MRRTFILLFTFVLITACNNDNKTNTQNKEGGQHDDKVSKDDRDDGTNNKDRDKKNDGQYNWTEREQNKFLEDCRRDSEENVDKGKLKDFCSCMLTQVQKYYPSYSQMDEKSDEDHDKEILARCLEEYGKDKN